MNKAKLITTLSVLLNRSSLDINDANLFNDKSHESLVEELRQYLVKNSSYFGTGQIDPSHALNEHGVDLLLEVPQTAKVGFQIKSHFDVKEPDFAAKVKRQMNESLQHGLDKWYLIICSPYTSGSENYTSKISHLINEFSSYKTEYHCVFSPSNIVGVFKDNSKFDADEFSKIIKMFSYKQSNRDEIIKEIVEREMESETENKKEEQLLVPEIELFVNQEFRFEPITDGNFQSKIVLAKEIFRSRKKKGVSIKVTPNYDMTKYNQYDLQTINMKRADLSNEMERKIEILLAQPIDYRLEHPKNILTTLNAIIQKPTNRGGEKKLIVFREHAPEIEIPVYLLDEEIQAIAQFRNLTLHELNKQLLTPPFPTTSIFPEEILFKNVIPALVREIYYLNKNKGFNLEMRHWPNLLFYSVAMG